MKLLLISNSTNYNEKYLEWPRPFINSFLNEQYPEALFIPYAGVTVSWDDYAEKVKTVFSDFKCNISSVHKEKNPIEAVYEAKLIIIGGGNTFNLVKLLHKENLMKIIREKVLRGVPFIGWSAGANVACPTMKTTNDMPITQPASFDCLNLVPFQINPHYIDFNPEGHGGETREQRILEFLELNKNVKVVGLRESSLLKIDNNKMYLEGYRNMRLFEYAKTPQEFVPGSDLSFLIN
ncbi:MAG TPA: dipeptidase PepE [Bacteroidales bacterium]|nr:dipeptidase PepE [Bacteroidales bacterium]